MSADQESAISRRLYIGDIPVSVTESEVKQLLSSLGAVVTSVDMKTKENLFEGSSCKTFAFADVHFKSEKRLNKCLSKGTVYIDGHPVNLAIAKEHFLAKLQRERQEEQASQSQGSH